MEIEKVLTDTPMLDEIIYNCKQMIYDGIILKDDFEADNNETESAIYFINMNNKHTVQSNLLFLNDKRMFAILCYYLRLTANIHKIYFK